MKADIISGQGLAIAAVSLALSGAMIAPAFAKPPPPVHCSGINSCKGKSVCKTANNACKGMNSCKSQGLTMAKSKEACEKTGGAVVD